jgi:hypothetical protein
LPLDHFINARTEAEGRRQQAIADADDAFRAARAEAERLRNADYLAARDAWDALKSFPNDPAYAETRDAFQRSKAPASLACARRQLAEAITKADQDYRAALVRLGQEHNVTVH